ncbi:MAG: YeeE/YedE family protein [Cyanobacterium sp. T60_A2020_053]|nr:YeeE/YedE family protein [Cyanobacterium sp. T60_A2020_053]
MVEFNWITSLSGGILIGISASLLLLFNGRIAGISGMINGALDWQNREYWRWYFLVGMIIGGIIYEYLSPFPPTPAANFDFLTMIIGGLCVGWGTPMGNGCTSGHGVCGLGRFSGRSLVAVITFMVTAMITVFIF